MENGAAHYDAILHAVTLVCSKTTSVERPCHLKKLAEQLLLIKLVVFGGILDSILEIHRHVTMRLLTV